MIAVILAAGRGSRLNDYTEELPKSLLPLNDNKTILDYNLSLLNELGIERKLIVTGYKSEKIEKHVEDHTEVKCIYNPFWDHCNVLGSLYMALPYIEDDFLFLHADTLVGKEGWEELISSKGDIVIPYQSKDCGEEEMKVRIDKEGSLLEINKTMKPETAIGEFLGIAKFNTKMVHVFQKVADSLFKNGKLNQYMEAVIAKVIDNSMNVSIKTFDIGNIPFVEIDFEDDYIEAIEKFK